MVSVRNLYYYWQFICRILKLTMFYDYIFNWTSGQSNLSWPWILREVHTDPGRKALLLGQLILQLFDASICLAKSGSSELSLRAVHCLWALNLQALQAFLFPSQGGEAADSTFSSLYPSFSIPQRPVYALQHCGCATSEALQTTKVLEAVLDRPVNGPQHGNNKRCCIGWGVVLMVA